MKNSFKVIGYYICEIKDTPKWLQGISRQILSVSGCIGEQHPRWEYFTGRWSKGEAREYQEKLQLDRERYREFSEMAGSLFNARKLDVDSRFLELSDAGFNDVGLLSNVFQEVERFAHQIEGKGEPVEWIPCRIGVHEQSADNILKFS